MNQKQRDLLCKMLATEASKVEKKLAEKFPLQGLSSGYNGNLSRYVLKDDPGEKAVSNLPADIRKKYVSLTRKEKRLSGQQNAINSEWNSLLEEVKKIRSEQEQVIEQARSRLKDAMQSATVDIQFAEDAAQAMAILDGLPSIDELLK